MTQGLALLVGASLALCGCSRTRSGATSQGDTFQIRVGAKDVVFANAEAEFGEAFGGHALTLFSHDGELNRLVIELTSSDGRLEDWVGKVLAAPDFSSDNPGKKMMGVNQNLNRFKADGKYYEGWRMGGRVREVKDGRVTVDLDCLFLEFPDAWGEGDPTGQEVRVTGALTLPLKPRS